MEELNESLDKKMREMPSSMMEYIEYIQNLNNVI